MTERTISAEEREDMRLSIESLAARRAYDAELGVSEWEAFLTPSERAFLVTLADLARLSAWVSGDVARARELAEEIVRVRDLLPTRTGERAAEIVALLSPPESE